MCPLSAILQDESETYSRWREEKLARYPRRAEDLIVEVRNPRNLRDSEAAEIRRVCGRANMAVYASPLAGEADKDIVQRLGASLGLERLQANPLADEDGITSLEVAPENSGRGYIPYTNRPIRWHTDGYYNPPQQRVRAMILHCVNPAAEGGQNALLDHEIAYILVRDESAAHIAALMRHDAMTIPARIGNGGEARPAQTGPVFSVDPVTGALHMRYTARTRSIGWNAEPAVASAVACLERLLEAPSPYTYRITLEPGMGVVANNVLHDRSAFADDPARPRLMYRARYYDRIAAGSGWRNG